ncbi:Xaa-Pro peptidase family protein [Alsobacter sp. SYSU M60028]|uniref:Xaa-Pro peptidase family protein n=1 Tax=Alsobacter ponti TaxID=2962936 RepID=A0ABT1LBK6_9HYPH|nr:Xaa-Pro peptidase family protein [Alsobacter ponti]MCP8938443.1 Xaa-Pro peptidase family protein [Alsobacter ponti]
MEDARLSAFATVMQQESLHAVALVPGANFRRVFGKDFHQNERPLVVLALASGQAKAVVPHLEMASFAKLEFKGEVFPWRDEEGFEAAFQACGSAAGALKTIGVEGQRMRVFEYLALCRAFPGAVVSDAHKKISQLRVLKTPAEIETLRRAVQVSEAALEATLRQVRVGLTETQVESILLNELFANGAEGLSFAPIVAAGSNSAQPHAKARPDYRIQEGDALLIDFGARVQGYCADLTRTVFVAKVSDEDRVFYDTVARANAAGREAARPGLPAGELDDLVLRVLETSPYRAFTRHKTGHGLGLDVHEEPYIMRGNATALRPGMVFTIEPGLYQLGKVGVRIEDDVVITENGCEVLSSFPRDLRIVG